MSDKEILETTKESLKRIRDFDVKSLARKETLGSAFELSQVEKPAKRLIDLFRLLPEGALEYFPQNELNAIETSAASTFKLFSDALSFDPSSEAEPAVTKKISLRKSTRIISQPFQSFCRLYLLP